MEENPDIKKTFLFFLLIFMFWSNFVRIFSNFNEIAVDIYVEYIVQT